MKKSLKYYLFWFIFPSVDLFTNRLYYQSVKQNHKQQITEHIFHVFSGMAVWKKLYSHLKVQ